jgi:hypothetical protein
MSFTRSRYQVNEYQRTLSQTTKPGNYSLNLPRNSCTADCFSPNPNVQGVTNSAYKTQDSKRLIDVDSELMGLNYKQTKCPDRKFLPSNEEFVTVSDSKDCQNFVGEATRLSNPPCSLRGTGWSRFEWLCQNPQDNRALEKFTRVIDTRLISKDSHRPCLPLPQVQDQSRPQSQDLIEGYSGLSFGGIFGGAVSNDPSNDPEIVMYDDQDHSKYPLAKDHEEILSQAHWKRCSEIS